MTDMAENQVLRVRDGAPGAALAAARTAQNLSITDVARQLKLSVSQVAALEAGEFNRLPGPVFVRGFIRNYARLLKLDPERILDSIVQDPSEQEVRNEMPASHDIPFPSASVRRWPKFILVALLAVGALAGYEFYWSERAAVTEVKPVTTPPVTKEQVSREIAPVTANDLPAPSAAQPEAPGTAARPAQETREAASSASQPPVAGQQAGEGELRFAFARNSWVQVRERGGKTIFTRLNPAGSEQRVSGKPPFMLVIGNAHGVSLTYNERPVDLEPYIVRDDVARFTLK
jgi:cytoskeleton protein RodZ